MHSSGPAFLLTSLPSSFPVRLFVFDAFAPFPAHWPRQCCCPPLVWCLAYCTRNMCMCCNLHTLTCGELLHSSGMAGSNRAGDAASQKRDVTEGPATPKSTSGHVHAFLSAAITRLSAAQTQGCVLPLPQGPGDLGLHGSTSLHTSASTRAPSLHSETCRCGAKAGRGQTGQGRGELQHVCWALRPRSIIKHAGSSHCTRCMQRCRRGRQ